MLHSYLGGALATQQLPVLRWQVGEQLCQGLPWQQVGWMAPLRVARFGFGDPSLLSLSWVQVVLHSPRVLL